jgi:Cu/Ag efflux pump CusA
MSNPRMTEIATGVTRQLRALNGVEDVAAHVGRAVAGDQRVDVNSGEVWVSIAGDADYNATLAAIEDSLADVDQVQHDVVTYTNQKIRDVGALQDGTNPASGNGLDVLTGTGKPLVVRLYGQDPEVLMQEAEKVGAVMDNVPGVIDPQIQRPDTQPTLEIAVDLEKARRFGIKPGDVRRAETSLLQGILVGSVFEAQKVFDVVVQGTPESRADIAAVRNLLIDRPGGGHVRLGQVADVRLGETPSSIDRDAVSRRVDIVADVQGDLGSVADEVKDSLATMSFPLEYHAEVFQRTTSREIGSTRMLAAAVAALIAAFLIMQAAFQSWRLAVLAFLSVPAAMVGGVAVVLLSGADLSLGALMGLLAVGVIAVRNTLVMLRHLQDVEREEGMPFGETLVRRGAGSRLQPIGAAALSLAALAVPFVVLGERAGLEIISPMAAVLLGGLVSTTLITLLLLPALYLRFGAGTAGRPEDELARRWGAVVLEPAAGAPAGNGGSTVVAEAGEGAYHKDEADAGETRA